MLETESGIVRVIRSVFLKALDPIVIMLVGIVTLINLEQFANVYSKMPSILSGIVIFFKPERIKAFLLICNSLELGEILILVKMSLFDINFVESLNQDERIEFTIEYKDGKEEKGKL